MKEDHSGCTGEVIAGRCTCGARRIAAPLEEKAAKAPVAVGVVQRFPRSMSILAQVSKVGARKHGVTTGDMTYLDIPDPYDTYTDALVRHIVDEKLEGPVNHKDGGLLHPAQAAWNALARLEVFLHEAEKSSR